MVRITILTIATLVCIFAIGYCVREIQIENQVDICNTPVYHLTVNQLNQAVKQCKK